MKVVNDDGIKISDNDRDKIQARYSSLFLASVKLMRPNYMKSCSVPVV